MATAIKKIRFIVYEVFTFYVAYTKVVFFMNIYQKNCTFGVE